MGIQWNKVRFFSKTGDQWPESPDRYADPKLIYTLDKYRDLLGHPVYVSPVYGALARFNDSPNVSKTSRHYVGNRNHPERLSDAIDIFPSSSEKKSWLTALSMPEWGAIGIYFDTYFQGQRRFMLHLDLRPIHKARVLWFRIDKKYYYPLKDSSVLDRLFNFLK